MSSREPDANALSFMQNRARRRKLHAGDAAAVRQNGISLRCRFRQHGAHRHPTKIGYARSASSRRPAASGESSSASSSIFGPSELSSGIGEIVRVIIRWTLPAPAAFPDPADPWARPARAALRWPRPETPGRPPRRRTRPCRGSINRDHHHDRRIGDRRKSHERSVVDVGVMLVRGIENLRRSGLAAARVTGSSPPAGRAVRHHAFHHLPHGDRRLRLDDAHRRAGGMAWSPFFSTSRGLHQQARRWRSRSRPAPVAAW